MNESNRLRMLLFAALAAAVPACGDEGGGESESESEVEPDAGPVGVGEGEAEGESEAEAEGESEAEGEGEGEGEGECDGAGDCDDGDACTIDDCVGGRCAHPPEPCVDGDLCTRDLCDPAAGCQHPPDDCNDGIACTIDSAECDPVLGCAHTPDDIQCQDGVACTGDACDLALGCVNQPIDFNCDDGVDCTRDLCDPIAGCTSEPDDTRCDDAVDCTQDVCDRAAGCFHNPDGAVCDDRVDCTADACDTLLGCANQPDHGRCADTVDCTADACDPARGCANDPDDAACDDAVACTRDACDPVLGCRHDPDDGACDDGVSCTVDSACHPAADCVHEPKDALCDDLIDCTIDACDAERDCANLPDDASCDDGVDCTVDLCDLAVGCLNEPEDALCDDGVDCTVDACDRFAGCSQVFAGEHLLIAEVVITPTDAESIEIHNPTGQTVSLAGLGLADFSTYYRLPASGPYDTADNADFLVGFPAGATLAPCGRAVVSVRSAATYQAATGTRPDYEIRGAADANTAAVPDMTALDPAGLPLRDGRSLANFDEMVILFRREGPAVFDLDYFFWGTRLDVRVDKTGEPGFAADTPRDAQRTLSDTHPIGGSFSRCDLGEAGERTTGGNGVTGHDETSEPLSQTWRIATRATPGRADPICPLGCGDFLVETVDVGDSVAGDTAGRANRADAGCGFSNSGERVYSVTAEEAGLLVASVQADFTPVVSVRRRCADAASEEACAEGEGGTAAAAFDAAAGETFLVLVEGRDQTGGPFTLEVFPHSCDASLVIPVAAGESLAGTTAGAADVVGASCAAGDGPEAVFAVTPDADGVLRASTEGSSIDTVLSLRRDCADPRSEVACNDDIDLGGGVLDSALTFPVRAGETWFLIVQGVGGASGAFALAVDPVASPCDGVSDVTGRIGGPAIGGSTAGATDASDGSCAPGAGGEVVYSIRSATERVVRASTVGSTVDTALSVRSECLEPESEIACNDEGPGLLPPASQVTFGARADQTYFLMVERARGADGALSLRLEQLANPCSAAAVVDRTDFINGPAWSGNTTGATDLADGSCGRDPGGERMLSVTAESDTLLRARAAGSAIDTVLSVRSDCFDPRTEVACGDDSAPGMPDAEVTWAAAAGRTYLIAVEGAEGASGAVQVAIESAPNPCGSALGAISVGGSAGASTAGATDLSDGSCGAGAGPERVYAFTPDFTGVVRASTAGSSFDTVLSARRDCADPESEIACNDDAPGSLQSEVTFAVASGETWFLAVEGFAGATGDFTLSLARAADPCDGPEEIAGILDGSPTSRNNSGATDLSDATCAATARGERVFAFTPPRDGVFQARAASTQFTPYLSVRSDCRSPASEGACAQGSISFGATAGRTLFLFVEGPDGEGDFQLELDTVR